MLLNEKIFIKPELRESNADKLPKGVLCRVTYPICNIGKLNHNNRIYEKGVWDKVLSNKDITEKMESRTLFGEAEHPEKLASDLTRTSHIITKTWIDESKGKVFQEIDVLDVPYGRLINTLLEAGCMVGVSTRAEGELEEVKEKNTKPYFKVITDSYKYITTDFTADPSTIGAIPDNVQHSVVSTMRHGLESKKIDTQFVTAIAETILKTDEAKKLAENIKMDKKCKKSEHVCTNCDSCKKLKEAVAASVPEILAILKDNDIAADEQQIADTIEELYGEDFEDLQDAVSSNDAKRILYILKDIKAFPTKDVPPTPEDAEDEEETTIKSIEAEKMTAEDKLEKAKAAIDAKKNMRGADFEGKVPDTKKDSEDKIIKTLLEIYSDKLPADLSKVSDEELDNYVYELSDDAKKGNAPFGKDEASKRIDTVKAEIYKRKDAGKWNVDEKKLNEEFTKDYSAVAKKAGLDQKISDIYNKYMTERWPEGQAEDYAGEWAGRFKGGREWQASDTIGRDVLKKLSPDKYKDVEEKKATIKEDQVNVNITSVDGGSVGATVDADNVKAVTMTKTKPNDISAPLATAPVEEPKIDDVPPTPEEVKNTDDDVPSEDDKKKSDDEIAFEGKVPDTKKDDDDTIVKKLTEDEKKAKPLSAILVELNNIKVAAAGTRAEKEQALELLAVKEAEIASLKDSKNIEMKALFTKLAESTVNTDKLVKEHKIETDALIVKIEEKVKGIKESADKVKALEADYTKKLDEMKTKLESEYNARSIKEYVNWNIKSTGLKVYNSSRALLEKCTTIEEADEMLTSIKRSLRQDALHPDKLSEIKIVEETPVNESARKIAKQVKDIANSLG